MNKEILKDFTGKTLLITGAAGTIGGEVVRRLSSQSDIICILLDRNENDLYLLQQELKDSKARLIWVLGDIQDIESMTHLFANYDISHVLHTAAYKQVPLMQNFPYELLKNNVLGLLSLLEISNNYSVEKFIFLSTDKAVNPSNKMGISKRIGELLIAYYKKYTDLNAVSIRFGNVIGSKGSVGQLFHQQLKLKKQIEITKSNAKRFFLTKKEAVDYCLFALTYKGKSSILVGNYSNELTMKDFANSFLEKDQRAKPNYFCELGELREGEKLEEELFYNQEKKKNINDFVWEISNSFSLKKSVFLL